MEEIIANIYLVINNNLIEQFKAKAYSYSGTDEEKINYLRLNAPIDFDAAFNFAPPSNDKGALMKYKHFLKLAKQGLEHQLFEEIFSELNMPEQPLICVTPVVNGKIISN